MMNSDLVLGYDLEEWKYYGRKTKIKIDISRSTNSHMAICGQSRSGKSYYEKQLFARLVKAEPDGEFYFADYKRDDSFACLRECEKYYCYESTLDALDIVYTRMKKRQSGEDDTRHFLTLIWDEYVVNISDLMGDKSTKGKKRAEKVMQQVSAILMVGISMGVRIIVTCQRADAAVFQLGARLNFGVIIILGAFVKSSYDMLMPDHVEQIKTKDNKFKQGEGSMLLYGGAELHFFKVGTVADIKYIEELCVEALE